MKRTFLSLAMAGTLAVGTMLSGCATSPNLIPGAYVSPSEYQDYDCARVAVETQSMLPRVTDLYTSTSLGEKAANDNAQMAVGLLVFWPMLFVLEGGDGPDAAEFARLKGQYEALQGRAVALDCADRSPPLQEAVEQARIAKLEKNREANVQKALSELETLY